MAVTAPWDREPVTLHTCGGGGPTSCALGTSRHDLTNTAIRLQHSANKTQLTEYSNKNNKGRIKIENISVLDKRQNYSQVSEDYDFFI